MSDQLFPEAPGQKFYSTLPEAVYRALPYCNQSLLKLLAQGKTPAHIQQERDNPGPATPAMKMGSLIHWAILQPELFFSECIVAPSDDKRTKAYKEALDTLPPGKELVTPGDYDEIVAIAKSARAHPVVRLFLAELGSNNASAEGVGIWRTRSVSDGDAEAECDTPYPVWCKIRPDLWCPRLKTIIDLKTTTQSADRENFQRIVYDYGYHLQAGFYVEGMRRLGYAVENYVIIAIERSAPHLVAAYHLLPEVVNFGWQQLQEPLRVWAECAHYNEWPGYDDQLVSLALPPWAMRDVPLE